MSIKETLDAIDLIAARCRIWAASLLTLFAGFFALDLSGALSGLLPPGSKWIEIIALVGMLVARYTHSKQSATAVIEAKADERVTPVSTMGALPTIVLLLLASMAFVACGDNIEEPVPVNSALSTTYVGGKQCWQGPALTYVQPATVSYTRAAFGNPSRYYLALARDTTVGTSSKTLETMQCDWTINLWGYGAPTCNASSYCNGSPSEWVSCAIFRKNVGETTYHLSRSGWVDYRQANFLPSGPASPTTFQGAYQMNFYSQWYGAEGPNGCVGGTSTTNHYDFH